MCNHPFISHYNYSIIKGEIDGYPNFLGVFARNLGVNFGGEKK